MYCEFSRYLIASLIAYALMFGGTLLFTEVMNVAANLSYLMSITINYIVTYFLNSFYVFQRATITGNAGRFTIHAALFWTLNNAFYSTMFYFTSIHYVLLIVINVMLFTILRFLSMRLFVFRQV